MKTIHSLLVPIVGFAVGAARAAPVVHTVDGETVTNKIKAVESEQITFDDEKVKAIPFTEIDAVLVGSHSFTLAADGCPTTISGATTDTHSPDAVTLYPALQAHAQVSTFKLPMKWLYLGSIASSHARHAAS